MIENNNPIQVPVAGNGQVLNLFCSNNYVPVGGQSSTCVDGQFQPPLGRCEPQTMPPATAPPPPTPPPMADCRLNRNMRGLFINQMNQPIQSPSVTTGSTVTISCTPGFMPNGNSQSICIDGSFEPQLGNCVPVPTQPRPPPPPPTTIATSRAEPRSTKNNHTWVPTFEDGSLTVLIVLGCIFLLGIIAAIVVCACCNNN